MLIVIIEVKLKYIDVGTVSLSMVTFTSKHSALLANQFIQTCKTHAQ